VAVAHTADVVLIGGGVMGCASALTLADAGAKVIVLERSVPGAEASSAAAGILGAQAEAHDPGAFTDLALESRARYAAWTERLRTATGIDVGYRPCGVLRVAVGGAGLGMLEAESAWQVRAGLAVEYLDGAAVLGLEPALAPVAGAIRFPDDARVDPPLLLKALHIAATAAGAEFRSGAYVRGVCTANGRATGVELDDGSILAAGHVVVAAGSWSTLVEGLPLERTAVRPARGQIVELDARAPILRSVVFGPGCYVVPRDDGRVLVGSTLEFVGYRREVTARAVHDLVGAAIGMVPALADAALGRAWSNFRPYTDSGRPLLGATRIQNLWLATGHHRNGILLAPITAEIIGALVRGAVPPLDLRPFSPESR
jgi:glycine oxidase